MKTIKGIWLAFALGVACTAVPAAAADDAALLRHNCAACHADPARPEAPLSRLDLQRKSPEGWEMTLRRMQMVHKAQFSDPAGTLDAEAVFARLVKHLSDTRGLAPQETEGFRYGLERRHNTIDVPADPEYAVMCTRCHSAARVGLQRRTEEEWRNLVHFHLAQYPTTEYQLGGRDRQWLPIALERMVPMLAERYPLSTPEWDAWQAAPRPALGGRWRVAGRMPGKGDFEGEMRATPGAGDTYALELDARFADGEALRASGRAVVYTGFEWRGSLAAGEQRYLQVLAADAAGETLSGRMFLADHPDRGIDISARRDDGTPALLAVSPAQIARGQSATLTLSGTALAGAVDLGPGLRVERVIARDADRLVLAVSAAADAASGLRAVRVGTARLPGGLAVYDRIDRIEVSPGYAVGRVGGAGGSQPEVQARFEAIAWGNGPDGSPGTGDDLRIGPVQASWSVAPWDAKAAADRDVDFAGVMDKDSGVFMPAAAGPNPARQYQTNNAGNLKVIATVGTGADAVSGEGRLLVTVQRWINPPLW